MRGDDGGPGRPTSGPTKPLRVVHCLYDVAGNAHGLVRAERELGLHSTAVVLRAGPNEFTMDEVLCHPEDTYLRQEVQRFRLLGRVLRHADVVHFNFGRSIMPPWKGWGSSSSTGLGRLGAVPVDLYLRALWMKDIPLLHAAGKALFVTFQGDDARQGDYCAAHDEVSQVTHVEPGYYTERSDAAKRRAIALFDRYVDGMFAVNPDLLRVLPKRARFVPYTSVDPREWPVRPRSGTGVPKVLHAPSHRGVKGTRFVIEAVEQLRSEGVPFEFRLVEGLRHEEARALYDDADLLVDQLLVGWYGALSVELMAMATPVVCYLRTGDFDYLAPPMRDELSIVNAEPRTISTVLRDLLTVRRGELPELGRRGRAYVERWHDPVRIATDMRDAYEDAVAARRRLPASFVDRWRRPG